MQSARSQFLHQLHTWMVSSNSWLMFKQYSIKSNKNETLSRIGKYVIVPAAKHPIVSVRLLATACVTACWSWYDSLRNFPKVFSRLATGSSFFFFTLTTGSPPPLKSRQFFLPSSFSISLVTFLARCRASSRCRPTPYSTIIRWLLSWLDCSSSGIGKWVRKTRCLGGPRWSLARSADDVPLFCGRADAGVWTMLREWHGTLEWKAEAGPPGVPLPGVITPGVCAVPGVWGVPLGVRAEIGVIGAPGVRAIPCWPWNVDGVGTCMWPGVRPITFWSTDDITDADTKQLATTSQYQIQQFLSTP